MERKTEPTKFEIQARQRINDVISEYCNGSQQELANRTKVAKASISQYVNGKNVPSNVTAMKLCAPFGLNPAWLMGFDVPKIKEPDDPKKIILTKNERSLIQKYRSCDSHGRYIVDYILNAEYERTKLSLMPIAAHHENDNDFTDEQNQKIREFTEMAMSSQKDNE